LFSAFAIKTAIFVGEQFGRTELAKCFKCRAIALGQRALFHVCVYHQMGGFAFGKNGSVTLAEYGVSKMNQRTPEISQLGSHNDLLVLVRR